jgi:hypothetical protein
MLGDVLQVLVALGIERLAQLVVLPAQLVRLARVTQLEQPDAGRHNPRQRDQEGVPPRMRPQPVLDGRLEQ